MDDLIENFNILWEDMQRRSASPSQPVTPDPNLTLDVLLCRLGSRREKTASQAMFWLVKWGQEATEPLVRLLTDGDANVRKKVEIILWRRRDFRVLPYLIPLLRDEDSSLADTALDIIRSLGGVGREATDIAQYILMQSDLTGSERLHLLRLLEQIVGREWKTKLRYPLGSFYLFCRQQARSDIEALSSGAKSVLDALTLPRASQCGTPREMLRAANQSHVESANTLLRPYKAK